jgi:hypothetical protein
MWLSPRMYGVVCNKHQFCCAAGRGSMTLLAVETQTLALSLLYESKERDHRGELN